MNFYEILQVSPNATKSEIKKAYHKLVIQYHPDKNNDINSSKKFHQIQTAYEILSDDVKRKEYDNMSNAERLHLYDVIKQYFTDIKPQYSYIYDSIIDFIYSNKEDEFKKDINNLNITNIFSKAIEKIKTNTIIKEQSKKKNIEVNSNKITLNVSLKEKYEDQLKYITVRKNNNQLTEYMVPLYKDIFVINDPEKGPISITFVYDENPYFKKININDLLYIKKISLSQYIYGSKIKFHHLDDEIIFFEFDSCLEKKPIYIISNKGLPYIDESGNKVRGNLYLYLTIEGINSINEDDISIKYTKVLEETIKLMFPPIE